MALESEKIMTKTKLTNKDHLKEIFRRICALVHFFISDRSKWVFPAEIGINHSREDVQYSSAQHDTLTADHYSFWHTTQSGEKQQFLHCSHCANSITLDGVSVEENPDPNTLIRLSKVYSPSEAEFIYEILARMFVLASHGLTVDQYIQQRRES